MYSSILFPVSVRDKVSWQIALPDVKALAKLCDADIHVMTVLPELEVGIVAHMLSGERSNEEINAAATELTEFIEENFSSEYKTHHLIAQGAIDRAIIESATELKSDVIVMAAHSPEIKDYFLKANSERVVKNAPCSVLVVRER